jgi:hypothetical protein
MCIKIKCKVCGEIFESPSIARTVCDKSECKKHSRYTPRTKELRCKICNAIIPVGSKRSKYCSKDCHDIAHKAFEKTWRMNHGRSRSGCFADVKIIPDYKPVDEVAMELSYV